MKLWTLDTPLSEVMGEPYEFYIPPDEPAPASDPEPPDVEAIARAVRNLSRP